VDVVDPSGVSQHGQLMNIYIAGHINTAISSHMLGEKSRVGIRIWNMDWRSRPSCIGKHKSRDIWDSDLEHGLEV
jgi:hypothetical protein